jgi:hypothetical protein
VVNDPVKSVEKWGAIGGWDVSAVTNFGHALSNSRNERGAAKHDGNLKVEMFNCDGVDKWTTFAVTSMYRTFYNAKEMNADLSGWTVTRVKDLSQLFRGAVKFEGKGLAGWKTTSLLRLHRTFQLARMMNVDVGGWDVSKVRDLGYAFNLAERFTGGGLERWTLSVTSLTASFSGAFEMNADLSGFDVSAVESLYGTFMKAKAFIGTGLINWDVSKVTHCSCRVCVGGGGSRFCCT